MQTKQTARLARKIRRMRERKNKGKVTVWRVVCEKLNILTEDGRADPGLAYKIGYLEYEPADRELRNRLGLRDICSKCQRGFRAPKVTVKQDTSPARAWWGKLKGEDREKLIELAYRNYLNWKQRQK